MAYPSYYRKTGTPGLGVLVTVNGIQIGCDSWTGSTYKVTYGPTSSTGFYKGVSMSGASNISWVTWREASLGTGSGFQVCNFSGSIPTFTALYSNPGVQSYQQTVFPNKNTYEQWSGYTYPQFVIDNWTGNTLVFPEPYELPDFQTSGLTFMVISNYCGSSPYFNIFGTYTAYDMSVFQRKLQLFNIGDSGTIRSGWTNWRLDGVDAYAQITGATSELFSGGNFSIFIAGAASGAVAQLPETLFASASGSQTNFQIQFVNATTSGVSMVIQTSASTYSSTTVGTNYNGFSGTGPGGTGFTMLNSSSYAFQPRHAIVKSGNTFSYYGAPYSPNYTQSPMRLGWEVTINDWGITNSSIPIDFLRNPITDNYARGSLQFISIYNRALNFTEIQFLNYCFVSTSSGEKFY